jgi:hypothetical protein
MSPKNGTQHSHIVWLCTCLLFYICLETMIACVLSRDSGTLWGLKTKCNIYNIGETNHYKYTCIFIDMLLRILLYLVSLIQSPTDLNI